MCVTMASSLLENVCSSCALSVAIQKVRFQEERVYFVKGNWYGYVRYMSFWEHVF